MAEDTITPELYEFVKQLTEGGFKMMLWPLGRVGEPIDYMVEVQVDGLTPDELRQLLGIVDGTPYEGAISGGWLRLRS